MYRLLTTNPAPARPSTRRPLDDHPSAKQVLDAWFAKYGLSKLPKYIFGISSGAAFAVKFPRTYPGLAGVVSGELWEEALGRSLSLSLSWWVSQGQPNGRSGRASWLPDSC